MVVYIEYVLSLELGVGVGSSLVSWFEAAAGGLVSGVCGGWDRG